MGFRVLGWTFIACFGSAVVSASDTHRQSKALIPEEGPVALDPNDRREAFVNEDGTIGFLQKAQQQQQKDEDPSFVQGETASTNTAYPARPDAYKYSASPHLKLHDPRLTVFTGCKAKVTFKSGETKEYGPGVHWLGHGQQGDNPYKLPEKVAPYEDFEKHHVVLTEVHVSDPMTVTIRPGCALEIEGNDPADLDNAQKNKWTQYMSPGGKYDFLEWIASHSKGKLHADGMGDGYKIRGLTVHGLVRIVVPGVINRKLDVNCVPQEVNCTHTTDLDALNVNPDTQTRQDLCAQWDMSDGISDVKLVRCSASPHQVWMWTPFLGTLRPFNKGLPTEHQKTADDTMPELPYCLTYMEEKSPSKNDKHDTVGQQPGAIQLSPCKDGVKRNQAFTLEWAFVGEPFEPQETEGMGASAQHGNVNNGAPGGTTGTEDDTTSTF
uniref:Ricin B lectin domain-containing protein n=1 Tax=Chromera velia CCMP2878 TaxID=1169474 RepID=A0A0G4HZD9_9ALVE|eukprot:Cvel_9711.t1-p1 / transcript=Cvel_9711.t1 / gene=Cvel_9711 / organism=Chromera_velia_CCMP2878 / gene_product=hypothetical protein / transcript_product=hypothetical protein / location=Cvel_scaffold566:69424-77006(+) / protein_length=436 / sequence_SO=supercontig / SO=protein_coding / is_pseudo=false